VNFASWRRTRLRPLRLETLVAVALAAVPLLAISAGAVPDSTRKNSARAQAPEPPPRVPAGFREQVLASALDSPTSMAVAPDGRVFVCEQAGAVRVVRDGKLLSRPFATVAAVADVEQGLLGIAFDPEFARTGWVYLCYTEGSPARHNRIVRFTASGDTALAGSRVIVYECDPHFERVHVGGALRFGPDGMLYAGTGDNDAGVRAQDLASTHGKILRIARDGGIPPDNPFLDRTRGRYRAIWAYGLRNAFAFDIHPRDGRMFINDVGGDAFEEIDEGRAGANYGWPMFEGPGRHGGMEFPIHAYPHSQGCAITGGAFYAPARPTFPRVWLRRYLFADFCANEIRWIDTSAPARARRWLGTRSPGPVDVRVAHDGSVLYLVRGDSDSQGGAGRRTGQLVRVRSTGGAGRR
jgi:glucose/arabinose dehydrogenase